MIILVDVDQTGLDLELEVGQSPEPDFRQTTGNLVNQIGVIPTNSSWETRRHTSCSRWAQTLKNLQCKILKNQNKKGHTKLIQYSVCN